MRAKLKKTNELARRYLPWLALLLGASACGKWASTSKQPTFGPEMPEFTKLDEHVLGLQAGATSVGYGGTMLIFNDTASGQQIADILDISIKSRKAWAEAKKFEVESKYKELYADNGVIENALIDMQAQLRDFESQALARNPLPLDEKLAGTKAWLKDELELLYGKDESPAKINAQSALNLYCDAKLIELATNSKFAKNLYTQRPSPMGFCESIYEAKEYFTSDSCSNSDTGKSYFECLWVDGVAKTSWFTDILLNSESNTENALLIERLLSEEKLASFQKVLSLDEEVLQVSSAVIKKLVFGTNGEAKNFFADIIQQTNEGSKVCSRVIPDLAEICSIFAIDYATNLDNETNLDFTTSIPLSPFDMISVMEERDLSLANSFNFPNASQSLVTTKEVLAFIGQRDASSHQNSENDLLLHQTVESSELGNPNFSPRLLAISSQVQKQLAGVVYPELSESDAQEYRLKESRIEYLAADLGTARAENERLQEAIRLSSEAGFEAGAAGKIEDSSQAAHGFIEIRMKLANRNGVLRSYFWIKEFEDFAVFGCYDLANSLNLNQSECAPQPTVDGIEASNWLYANEIMRDESSAKFTFGFEIRNPELMGLGPKARAAEGEVADGFMDLASEEISGRQLVFELYPNRALEYLEVMSGKAFIKDGDKILYEAGVSIWDQNL